MRLSGPAVPPPDEAGSSRVLVRSSAIAQSAADRERHGGRERHTGAAAMRVLCARGPAATPQRPSNRSSQTLNPGSSIHGIVLTMFDARAQSLRPGGGRCSEEFMGKKVSRHRRDPAQCGRQVGGAVLRQAWEVNVWPADLKCVGSEAYLRVSPPRLFSASGKLTALALEFIRADAAHKADNDEVSRTQNRLFGRSRDGGRADTVATGSRPRVLSTRRHGR